MNASGKAGADRWTIPAGFMEKGETTTQGAEREAWEEARAKIEMDSLLGIYNIPRISQVQLLYRARLLSPDVAVGEETSEVRLFEWGDIPWDELAFPSVSWVLQCFSKVRGKESFAPFAKDDTARRLDDDRRR